MTDVVVVGAGAAGLMAASVAAGYGAEVAVMERSAQIGGSAAMSGGMLWLPVNHRMKDLGLEDSRLEALRYLRRLTAGHTSLAILETFLNLAPATALYLEEHGGLRLRTIARPDYHSDWDGAKLGRSLDIDPFDIRDLVPHAMLIRGTDRAPLTFSEAKRSASGDPLEMSVIGERRASKIVTQATALVAALFALCLRKGVTIRCNSRVVDLLEDRGQVVGVAAAGPGSNVSKVAARSVVLASGGYEWNERLVSSFLGPPRIVALTPRGDNAGDGLLMGTRIGAAVANLHEAWWCVALERGGGSQKPDAVAVIAELALPGSILVNAAGDRFVDEALNYNEVGRALRTLDPATGRHPNSPAWLIFDENFRRRCPVGGSTDGDSAPGWLVSARTIPGLAGSLGLKAEALTRTIELFNSHASLGRDPRFARGESLHDRFYGLADGSLNAYWAPIQVPPFHAAKVHSGVFGTKGGLITDSEGRVIRHGGGQIKGLFAVGNVAASWTGRGYPGAGGTLGPILTASLAVGRAASGAEFKAPVAR